MGDYLGKRVVEYFEKRKQGKKKKKLKNKEYEERGLYRKESH
jgi:hypothetical protein